VMQCNLLASINFCVMLNVYVFVVVILIRLLLAVCVIQM